MCSQNIYFVFIKIFFWNWFPFLNSENLIVFFPLSLNFFDLKTHKHILLHIGINFLNAHRQVPISNNLLAFKHFLNILRRQKISITKTKLIWNLHKWLWSCLCYLFRMSKPSLQILHLFHILHTLDFFVNCVIFSSLHNWILFKS